MSKKTKVSYTDEPMGKVNVIDDFLPSPEQLVKKEENVKVTISLTKSSLDFFKSVAKQNHTQYQKMIRNLVDEYARNYRGAAR
jgi:predicted DNA binding CopG/RHH family protein